MRDSLAIFLSIASLFADDHALVAGFFAQDGGINIHDVLAFPLPASAR